MKRKPDDKLGPTIPRHLSVSRSQLQGVWNIPLSQAQKSPLEKLDCLISLLLNNCSTLNPRSLPSSQMHPLAPSGPPLSELSNIWDSLRAKQWVSFPSLFRFPEIYFQSFQQLWEIWICPNIFSVCLWEHLFMDSLMCLGPVSILEQKPPWEKGHLWVALLALPEESSNVHMQPAQLTNSHK